MRKRDLVRIISFCITAVIVTTGFYMKERKRAQNYLLQLENEYAGALSEMNGGINNISLLLEKTGYVTTPAQVSAYAAQMYSEAEIAKAALSKLPVGQQGLEVVNRFLSQVGNYALSVSKSLILGNPITEAQTKNLELLSKAAKTISEAISTSDINFNNLEYWAGELDQKLSEEANAVTLASSLTELEENLTDYPTLIYDGPYSDHILLRTPLMIENAAETSQETALKTAAKALGAKTADVKFDGMDKGKMEAYRFSNSTGTATVSKKGNYIVYMRKNRTVGNTTQDYSIALSKAKKYLSDMGFNNMTETYYFTDEGICTINFAYLDGQTICYTDLIKVGVAMDNGEIMLYEASGYLFNHTDRAFETAAHTMDEARAILNPNLQITESSVALIPSDGGSEIRCYEFLCHAQGPNAGEKELLIYINVMNLQEEQIFVLLKTDGGTVVK